MEGLTLDSLLKQVCDKLDTHQFALAGKSTTDALVFFLQVILDSMTPSSAFATLISMKQGEKTQKIVAKYVYDRFRERDRRVKYNLV